MKAWVWALIGLAFVGFVLFLLSLAKIASRNSRREEAYYRLHPPDRSNGPGKGKHPDSHTGNQADHDSNANRCVCCGEIIPEGQQTCMYCQRRAEQADVWW